MAVVVVTFGKRSARRGADGLMGLRRLLTASQAVEVIMKAFVKTALCVATILVLFGWAAGAVQAPASVSLHESSLSREKCLERCRILYGRDRFGGWNFGPREQAGDGYGDCILACDRQYFDGDDNGADQWGQ